VKRAAAFIGGVLLVGVALYSAAAVASLTLWMSLWAVSGWSQWS
jgi:hypothetical protein